MSCFQFLLKLKEIFSKQPKYKHQLARLFRNKYIHTIFYDSCQSTLRYIVNDLKISTYSSEDDEDQNNKRNRKSITKVSHYQNNNIPSSSSSIIPSSIFAMSIDQKQILLKRLIEQSYMFLDFSDMLQNQDVELYESMIKQQIFSGEQSILQTKSRVPINDKLKYFDSQALHLLSIYIKFCKQVLDQISINQSHQSKQTKNYENQSFLSRLILQLKATLLTKFPESQLTSYKLLKRFIKDFNIMIDILITTVCIKYTIKASQSQFAQNFFTKLNIKSLLLFIVFSDQVFLKSVYQRFYHGIKQGLNKLTENLTYDNEEFAEELKYAYLNPTQENRRSSVNYKSNIQKILEKKIKFPFFKKSLRILQTISSPKQPIKVLKIIYQVNKTIASQHTQFILSTLADQFTQNSQFSLALSLQKQKDKLRQSKNKQNKENGLNVLSFLQPDNNRFSMYDTNVLKRQSLLNPKLLKKYSFSREIECIIIKWMLSVKKDKIKFIITNCLMAYFFVNENELKDKKGSALMPFIQIIQQHLDTNNYYH